MGKNMTAVISAFSRAYHFENNEERVFSDTVARRLLYDDEYSSIADNMVKGIGFFNPEFCGSESEALRFIVDNQLSPSPLGRAAFCEKSLETDATFGTRQYLILGAGYDTFAYRQPSWASDLEIFETDLAESIADKMSRLEKGEIEIPENVHFIETDFTTESWAESIINNTFYHKEMKTFASVLGVSYYLEKEAFVKMLHSLSRIVPFGSTLVFDYPDENTYSDKAGNRTKKQTALAAGANEKMLSGYSYQEMEKLLADCGFSIYEHLIPEEITEQYFMPYNLLNPSHKITAFDNVNYCLAVRAD